MKTKLLFTIYLVFSYITLIAQPVNINITETIARNLLKTFQLPKLKSAYTTDREVQVALVKTSESGNDTLYYVLNDTIHNSFVIVSGDKRAWPIIGFSYEGYFDEQRIPEALSAFLELKGNEIENIKKNNPNPDSKVSDAWRDLELKSANLSNSVGPLLTTQWGQGCFYNEKCPADPQGPCGHAVTGCVATAMAQIMKYWNFPNTGIGSKTYINPTYGSLSADFGSTVYLWNQMVEKLGEKNDAVATLLYHCGVSVNMGYGPEESGGSFFPEAFINYFDYSTEAKLVFSSDYNLTQWSELLRKEIDLLQPVLYNITFPDKNVGHALICDGYANEYFHFNWGWGGDGNGYYYLGDSQFFGNNSMMIGLKPGQEPPVFKGLFLSSKEIDFSKDTEQVTLVSSANWSLTTDQEWIRVNTERGSAGTSVLSITIIGNASENDREALITVTTEGFPSQVIKVKQKRSYNYTVSAGELKQAVGDNLETATKLIVTGTIDARDFKIMRDEMPNLSYIDLSNATIVAYNGSEGTSPVKNTFYQANTIPEYAFDKSDQQGNTTLAFFILPESTINIDRNAFFNCFRLTDVSIPSFVTTIQGNAFGNCTSLKKISIPASVTSIDIFAFRGCIQLSEINVDAGNQKYSSTNGILFNKAQTQLIIFPESKSGNYIIPSSVKYIGDYSFKGCSNISAVSIPSSVQSLGNSCFEGCTGLNTLSLPVSVQSIGSFAFSGCSGLTSINISWPVPPDLSFSPQVFNMVNKNACTLNVPYSTASLYANANQWEDFLDIVEPENGITLKAVSVNIGAEENCSANIELIANVSWTAASDSPWLSVDPASGSTNTTLTFTANKNTAVSDRTAIVTISATGFDSQSISVTQNGGAIELQAGNLSEILTEPELSSMTYLKLSGTIDARDFRTMRDLMPLLNIIDLSETSIVSYSGTGGTSYGINRYYPDNTIPDNAFFLGISTENKIALSEILFPLSMKAIGNYAFYNCSELSAAHLPSGVSSIGNSAFRYCEKLSAITVSPDNQVYSSTDGVLFNKSGNTIVMFPEKKSDSYTIPSSVEVIGSGAFFRSNITQINISNSVKTIEQDAFSLCNWLKAIKLPASISFIGSYAFSDCANTTRIDVNRPVPVDLSNSQNVFRGIDKNECTLNVPFGCASLYKSANQWKDFLKIIEASNGFRVDSVEKHLEAKEGSTANISLNSNVRWTATSDQSWLSVSPVNGDADAILTFTAQANKLTDSRIAKITITSDGFEPQYITIIQATDETATVVDPDLVQNEAKIYPNPSTGKINLVLNKKPEKDITIIVSDATGRICFKQQIRNIENSINLNLKKPGIYILQSDQVYFKPMKFILK